MPRHVLQASLALMALALAACASPGPASEAGPSGQSGAGEMDGNAVDNSTAGSGALIGGIWF